MKENKAIHDIITKNNLSSVRQKLNFQNTWNMRLYRMNENENGDRLFS